MPGLRRAVRAALAAAWLGSAVVLAGCASGPGGTGELAGTSWTATSIDGVDTIAQARPTIRFAPDGTVGGSSGCNQFSGPYRIDGETISIGQLASTQIGCDEERMAQEAAFLGALGGATTWSRTGAGELELSGTGRVVLRAG